MLRLLDTPPSPDAPRASTSPRKRGEVKAAHVDAPCVTTLIRFTFQTAMRNPPRPWVGATVAVVFPPWQGGALPLASRGAERRVALRVFRCTPCGVRVPLAKGTQRRSALHAAVVALRGRTLRCRGFKHLRLKRLEHCAQDAGRHRIAIHAPGSYCPRGGSPCRPGAVLARHGPRAPHPAPPNRCL
jgi:hypothetical protein